MDRGFVTELDHVSVSYGQENVLKDISFSVKEGEHCAILGPNGSGKTTLIRLFSQDIYPRREPNSSFKIFGKQGWNIWDLKSHLSIISNDLHTRFVRDSPGSTGIEAVISGFYSSLGRFRHQEYSSQQKEKAEEVMEFLHITHLRDHLIGRMSTGEIRRCVVGRALVHEPRAILLDEPTVGLDIRAQYEFREIMRKLSRVATVILVTHHVEEIIPEISTVILLKEGSIYQKGPIREVLRDEYLSHTFDIRLRIDEEKGMYRVYPGPHD